MENASKALIIASTILLTLMIISVAVALFRSFGGSGREIISDIERRKIQEFNSNFTKYIDQDITAHDIVTIFNLVYQNNKDYEVASESDYSSKIGGLYSNYISINWIKGAATYTHVEIKSVMKNKLHYADIQEFLEKNFDAPENKFIVSNIVVNQETGRVWEITIKEN